MANPKPDTSSTVTMSRTQLQNEHIFAEELDWVVVLDAEARTMEGKPKVPLPTLLVQQWDNNSLLPSPSRLGTWFLVNV